MLLLMLAVLLLLLLLLLTATLPFVSAISKCHALHVEQRVELSQCCSLQCLQRCSTSTLHVLSSTRAGLTRNNPLF
jgi:hypothetical protein